jgi:hypothetical protein
VAQVETKADQTTKSLQPNYMLAEFAAMGDNFFAQLATIQTDVFKKLHDANRSWLDRMQLEADLASELRAKLTKAGSIPETATAYQDWAKRRTEMAAEDTKRFLADGQKLMETAARMLSSGWLPNGHAGRT